MPGAFRSLTLAAIFVVGQAASAVAVPITVTGNSTGALSAATGELTFDGGVLTLALTNTSLFDARITGIGFDLVDGDFAGNSAGLNGFSGNSPASFLFKDGLLGAVPQFNGAVLDFGWTTGASFTGGNPNSGLDQLVTVTFTVTGLFPGLTAEDLAAALFVRFQRVGADGQGSDVGRNTTVAPEPATLLLIGSGLAAVALRRRKKIA